MQKTIFITASILLAGSALAQQQSESVESILNELGNYEVQKVTVPAESSPQSMPAPESESMPAPEPQSMPASEPQSMPAADPDMPETDLPEVMEKSREAYAMGEFERAQLGFEKVVALEPENIIARMYLRKIIERDARKAEISGMKAVTAAWDTSVVLRSYPISSDAAEKMELGEVEGPVDIRAKFPEVEFPKGTAAMYQPKMEKIFVRNTVENLTIIEEVLDAMDVAKTSEDIEQVEIEAKFVEVSEGTLEALGFEWNFANNVNSGIMNDDITLNDGNGIFTDALRANTAGDTLPFARQDTLGAGSSGANIAARPTDDWSAFRFESTFNDTPATMTIEHNGSNPLDVLISALDQSSGADVLSAPRIVTQSGEEAIIRVGQQHIYPEVYEPNASGGNLVHVVYEDWEEKLLGVELTVTPQVDGDQIEMELNPKITELLGWQTYDVAGANSSYTWYQYRIGLTFQHDDIKARLPIFRVRNIETEVTISDGATIGMGGLVNERIESYEDKVPLLGSMPLVGRLFRSEGERAVKRNLLMFVTAKRVEPTGRIKNSRSFR